jgi:hypothetical protein
VVQFTTVVINTFTASILIIYTNPSITGPNRGQRDSRSFLGSSGEQLGSNFGFASAESAHWQDLMELLDQLIPKIQELTRALKLTDVC